jgi:hypothetical protein
MAARARLEGDGITVQPKTTSVGASIGMKSDSKGPSPAQMPAVDVLVA